MPYEGVTKTMTCRGCGNEYTATSTGRLPQWCSPECKRINGPKCRICGDRAKSIGLCPKHWTQHKNHGGPVAIRTCKHCGGSFQQAIEGRGKARATCSPECRNARKHVQRAAEVSGLSRTSCTIDGCDKPLRSAGSPWCEMHYGRVRVDGAPGEPEERSVQYGEEHRNWIGDDAGYRAVHNRMTRTLGKASTHPCVDCGEQAHHWSYNHTDPDEKWVDVERSYLAFSPDASHYSPRCAGCHLEFDLGRRRGVVNFQQKTDPQSQLVSGT